MNKIMFFEKQSKIIYSQCLLVVFVVVGHPGRTEELFRLPRFGYRSFFIGGSYIDWG